jgi:hypothetical protein
MLVNDAFVRRFAGGRDVVGTTLALAMRIPPSSDFPMGDKTIVGVVADTIFRSVREPIRPAIYVPLSQWEWAPPQYTFFIGVRSSTGDPASIVRTMTEALRSVNPDVALEFETLRGRSANRSPPSARSRSCRDSSVSWRCCSRDLVCMG